MRAGDTLVVTKLDRLGRSVKHLKEIVDDLQARGVGLRALSQEIDLSLIHISSRGPRYARAAGISREKMSIIMNP